MRSDGRAGGVTWAWIISRVHSLAAEAWGAYTSFRKSHKQEDKVNFVNFSPPVHHEIGSRVVDHGSLFKYQPLFNGRNRPTDSTIVQISSQEWRILLFKSFHYGRWEIWYTTTRGISVWWKLWLKLFGIKTGSFSISTTTGFWTH